MHTYIVVTQYVGEWDGFKSPQLLRVDSETKMSYEDMQMFLKPHGYNPTRESLDFKELSQITNIT